MVTLKIKVTKKILEESKYCGSAEGGSVAKNCAIANAVRDVFPLARVRPLLIDAFGNYTQIYEKIPLPYDAQEYIIDFDRATPQERVNLPELEFEIQIPDSIIEKINIDEIMPLLENHPTLQLITE